LTGSTSKDRDFKINSSTCKDMLVQVEKQYVENQNAKNMMHNI